MKLKYMCIYNRLKQEICSGLYPVGSLLPTESQLAQQFSASKVTVRHALAMLIADKLIKVTQGRGAEVLSHSKKTLHYNRYEGYTVNASEFVQPYKEMEFISTPFLVETISTDEAIAVQLDLETGTPIYQLQYSHLLGETPFSYITTYVPCSFAPNLNQYISQISRLYPFLIEKYGISLTNTQETLTFGTANLIESKLLATSDKIPVIRSCRTLFSNNTKISFSKALLRADVLKLTLVADTLNYMI